MNKEEIGMIGFEIVAYAGEARSKLLEALNNAKKGNFENTENLIKEANESLTEAHNSQTQLLAAEAEGKDNDIGFIMIHAQDHLMTTLLLSDVIETLLDIYRER